MLIISAISKSYGERVLFRDLSFSLYARDRLGIVGPNGSGKTTLLDIIAGHSFADTGEVSLQKGASIGYLEQNLTFDPDTSLIAEVVRARSEEHHYEHRRTLIHDRLAETTDPGEQELLMRELGDLEARFEHTGGYTVEHEAKKILAGLGFKDYDYERPTGTFSGGWKMRIGLAKLLLSEPDLLFLDEPTNHLDLEALLWFEDFLRQYDGAVIVISHDRAFLNRTVTKIIAFEAGSAKLYTGTYDNYEAVCIKEREILEATVKNRERLIEHEMRFIERFRAKNTKSTQVQSRIKRLEKLEAITVGPRAATVRLHIPESPRSGKSVVTLDRLTFGYESDPLYENLTLSFLRGEKIAFVGPNGAGKSTLLKLLAGILRPDSGSVVLGHNVRPVYYAQHQSEQLIDSYTVLEEIRRVSAGETDERLRTILGSFLFSGDDVEKKVSVLSGGEKARLALAKLFLHPANLILMDEPTNHLDIPSRDVLAEALAEYDGTLCLVTHDRDLIDRTANRICEVNNGVVTLYHGNYSEYREKKDQEKEVEKSYLESAVPQSEDRSPTKKIVDKERKRREGELRNRFYRESKLLRKRIDAIESEQGRITGRIAEIEAFLADPSSMTDRQAFAGTLNEYQTLKTRKEALDDEWLERSMELDSLRDTVFGEEG